ncbi:hypothetical protein EEL31_19100 [Brevibacillus laterosporus]|nr:hypothetical protein [Brevibacillus laterosporus]TPG70393.1 hypothetical protein EEL31_19100 [Brevibacillus laterosporus]
MIKLKLFLFCLLAIFLLFSMTASLELFSIEHALARSIFSDVMDDMRDIGYLDRDVERYYSEKMNQLGWEAVDGDYFQGSFPRQMNQRVSKEKQQFIELHLQIRPSRVARLLNKYTRDDYSFAFYSRQPSEYFDVRW